MLPFQRDEENQNPKKFALLKTLLALFIILSLKKEKKEANAVCDKKLAHQKTNLLVLE